MEGYHYRFHPSAQRWRQIAQQEVGTVRSVKVVFTMFDPKSWFGIAGSKGSDDTLRQSEAEKHLRIKMLDRWCVCVYL